MGAAGCGHRFLEEISAEQLKEVYSKVKSKARHFSFLVCFVYNKLRCKQTEKE